MNKIVNKNGVEVEVGKWYNFYNLKSCAPTERLKVTKFLCYESGECYGVEVENKTGFYDGGRWLNWIFS